MKLSAAYLALIAAPALAVPFSSRAVAPASPGDYDKCRSTVRIKMAGVTRDCPLVSTDICVETVGDYCDKWGPATITDPTQFGYTDRCRDDTAIKEPGHIANCPLVESDVCIRWNQDGCDMWAAGLWDKNGNWLDKPKRPVTPKYTDKCREDSPDKKPEDIAKCPLVKTDICVRENDKGCDLWAAPLWDENGRWQW